MAAQLFGNWHKDNKMAAQLFGNWHKDNKMAAQLFGNWHKDNKTCPVTLTSVFKMVRQHQKMKQPQNTNILCK